MIKIAFTGCGLGDFIYKNIDFNSAAFQKYVSIVPGDGGLVPGQLVFTEELEKFSGKSITKILNDICGLKVYDAFNIGGPALVSAICAAQILFNSEAQIRYFGAFGNDKKAKALLGLLEKLPLNIDNLSLLGDATPYTTVLSDPNYNQGRGERTFINNIGAAGLFDKSFLNTDFWNSNIVVFGGTGIVPQLHSQLTELLALAKNKGVFTVVNTVFDFISEKKNPDSPWPLGDTLKSLPLIDLLIMDYEEAKRISGQEDFKMITEFYKKNGANAFIITHGSEPTYIYSSGQKFENVETFLPVCNWISEDFERNPALKGDTTGCGDNFVGGAIASIAMQMNDQNNKLSLIETAVWGTVSGGFACYYTGGTYFEKYWGEKLEKISEMYVRYNNNLKIKNTEN